MVSHGTRAASSSRRGGDHWSRRCERKGEIDVEHRRWARIPRGGAHRQIRRRAAGRAPRAVAREVHHVHRVAPDPDTCRAETSHADVARVPRQEHRRARAALRAPAGTCCSACACSCSGCRVTGARRRALASTALPACARAREASAARLASGHQARAARARRGVPALVVERRRPSRATCATDDDCRQMK